MKLLPVALFVILFITAVHAENPPPICYYPGEFYTCHDTDGQDYYTQGTVSGLHTPEGDYWTEYSHTDYCVSDDTLLEYYCTPGVCNTNRPATEEILCEFGCEDGACREYEIPEFGLVALTLALAGALLGFFLIKKQGGAP